LRIRPQTISIAQMLPVGKTGPWNIQDRSAMLTGSCY